MTIEKPATVATEATETTEATKATPITIITDTTHTHTQNIPKENTFGEHRHSATKTQTQSLYLLDDLTFTFTG